METCNLCKQVIKPGEQVVYRSDYHHKDCWLSFEIALKEELDKLDKK